MIDDNIKDIVNKYVVIKNNYNKVFFNNVVNFKNTNTLKNIHIKGIELIENIFKISLLYLDNLIDIYNLCEKGYIYYIEFVNQINCCINNETSFELTIKDAQLFSYKKTIFSIDSKILLYNNEIKEKKIKIVNKVLMLINKIEFFYNNKLYNFINIKNIDQYKLEDKYNEFLNKLSLFIINNTNDQDKSIHKIKDYFINSEFDNISNINYIDNEKYNNFLIKINNYDNLILLIIEKYNHIINNSDSNSICENIDNYNNNIIMYLDKILTKKKIVNITNINIINDIINDEYFNKILNNINLNMLVNKFD